MSRCFQPVSLKKAIVNNEISTNDPKEEVVEDKEVPQDPNNEEPKENDPDEEKVSEFVPGVELYSAPDSK